MTWKYIGFRSASGSADNVEATIGSPALVSAAMVCWVGWLLRSSPTTPTMLRSCSACCRSWFATRTPWRMSRPALAMSSRTIGSAEPGAFSCRSWATAKPSSDSRSLVSPSARLLDDVSASSATSVMYGRSGWASCSFSARWFWSSTTASTCRIVASDGWKRSWAPSVVPTHSLPVQVSQGLSEPQCSA